jgi:hypothetical protein
VVPYFTDKAALHLFSSFTFENLRHNIHLTSVTKKASSQLMLSKSTPSFILRNGRTNGPKYFKISPSVCEGPIVTDTLHFNQYRANTKKFIANNDAPS